MIKKPYSYGAGKPSGNNRGVLEDAAPIKSKPKFKVYGVLEMWDAYHLGKNDGTIGEMEYLLSKKVE